MKGNIKAIRSFIFGLLAIGGLVDGSAQTLSSHMGEIDLYGKSQIVDLGQQDLSFEEFLKLEEGLNFREVSSPNENIDFTDGHHWVRFELNNNKSDSLNFYLLTARPVTDYVDLYQVQENGETHSYHTGDALPFDQKNVKSAESVFNIVLAPNSKSKFYMHLKSDGEMILLPMRLFDSLSFFERSTTNNIFYGLFYGMLLISAIIYSFFYKSLKISTFLYYGLYIVSFSFLQFSLDGFTHQFLFPEPGWLYSKIVLISGACSTVFLGFYANSFLELKTRLKSFWYAFNGIYSIVGLLFIGLLVSPGSIFIYYPLFNGFGLLTILMIIISIIILSIRKVKIDSFFILGILFLTLGFTVFILNNFSLVPSNIITINSSKFGSALEIIFLSLSMSNLIKQLREDKEKSQELALKKSEEANELKLYFMSNISHELRTPLNAIMGISNNFAEDKSLDEEHREDIAIIRHSSQILLNSINNILDFSKIEKNELRIAKEKFDLQALLNELNAIWKLNVEDKGLEFHFQGLKASEIMVLGDYDRLYQIITNVVENAVKFTSHGKISIRIEAKKTEDSKINLEILVEDTGVGISDEKMDIIYLGFSQERIDDKRLFGGLGLGLTIAQSLIRLHGGDLNLKSTIGKGTNCSIKIPLQLIHWEEEKKIVPEIKEEKEGLEGIKILVAEDNPLNQFIMRKVLGTWNISGFHIAENGEDALNAFKAEDFDIILMDLQMPIMDGYEACTKIRSGEAGEEKKNIAKIAVTADVSEKAKQRVKELGMNDYVTKPFTAQVLLEKVKGCLNLSFVKPQ
tara:strand:- start:15317 stop:17716 length:2400 start_codon:yes stop_codon:yes gene_type:complete